MRTEPLPLPPRDAPGPGPGVSMSPGLLCRNAGTLSRLEVDVRFLIILADEIRSWGGERIDGPMSEL